MVVPSIDLFRLRCSRLAPQLTPRQTGKRFFAVTIAGLLASCVASPSYNLGADAPGVPLDSAASPSASASPAEFSFPQASCSDRETTPTSTWYPVVIKGGNLDEIRAKYCQDAIGTIQAITGEPTVQVASFTSYEKAQQFAQLVGGTVDAQPVAQASESPTPGINPSTSPTASPTASPAASPSPQPSSATQATGSGTLNTADGSPINIRTSASVDAPVQEVGSSGESIQILSSSSGSDGYTWYNVQTVAGVTGWVRGDLVSNSSPTGGTTSDSAAQPSSIASAPNSTTQPSANRPTSEASPETAQSSQSPNSQSSTLTASDPDASINVRASADIDAPVQTTAYAGDPVRIVDRTQGADGYTWYSVQFESGATGWVRGDFVQN
ncbi:SH3 domain-containing protein [Leptolyngbya sp. FACHB-711]|uniref:SH3 domain-containing protein n=1 Tax=unclassified Leptolyngbya TaxID=2650499 RepID=UPI001682BD4F|nr:SH3 domain-containing protein [Leptolyngbya sp. FACHB-711]MBD1850258.1 SH3 domain-containing protein [Cyanobacteria bacterium FACHB-502]MBD2025620.1 SH3 domain-containing protein [Leptolyngbya sp. FACHB-711]